MAQKSVGNFVIQLTFKKIIMQNVLKHSIVVRIGGGGNLCRFERNNSIRQQINLLDFRTCTTYLGIVTIGHVTLRQEG